MQNFSIPDPTPESIMTASILEAARTTPASVLPLLKITKIFTYALFVYAPIRTITGVGSLNLSLSATSEILKPSYYGSGIWTSLAGLPAGIIISHIFHSLKGSFYSYKATCASFTGGVGPIFPVINAGPSPKS